MPTLDERIRTIDNAICRYLDNLDNNDSIRAVISQDILAQLRKLTEHLMLKFYANGNNLDITADNIKRAAEYSQSDGVLKVLYRFRNYLEIVTAHLTLDEENSERLMLKYYDYLLEIKNIVYYYFKTVILHNLDKFPLNQDTALLEYYTKIAEKIMLYPSFTSTANDKYYIQKLKPFFINGRRYYEVTFTPATDKVSKSRRVIAFTSLPVTSNYASKFNLIEEHIEILGKTMPILIITGWEVSIRDCEFKNFGPLLTGVTQKISYPEQKEICNYLTHKGYSLTEIIDFSDAAYNNLINSWRVNLKSDRFIQILTRCREIIRSERSGQNMLRYLLYCMNNTIIKDQRSGSPNDALSNLYLPNGCRPFDRMPFVHSPLNHNPRLGALFESIKIKGREHELLARQIKNNTEISGKIFTPVSELAHYGDVTALANAYYYRLWDGHRERSQIIVNNGFAYINEYKLDTCNIIDKLLALSNIYDPNYRENISFWLEFLYDDVDCEEKSQILMSMFEYSKVAVIYGSAGVGKSTIINYISHFYADRPKLYLTQTNSAKDNLMRRVTVKHENCEFNTVASFIKYGSTAEYELLVLDECSTISNADMVKVLNIAKFERILLVGDTYQINSIRFGNWFTAIKAFLPSSSVFELTRPYRTTNPHLLDVWAKVRRMDGDVQEFIEMESCSLNVDDSLLSTSKEDSVILCLNYDGLYGINNINRFLQESNPNPAFQWDIQCYKVGDPVLFLENNRFYSIIYNNMRGIITGIAILDKDTVNERIQFDIELNAKIDSEYTFFDITYMGESERGNSIVRFDVYKNKNVDEDDDLSTSKTIVPFQIAYAVSIHKAQGLEYDSVKIVITDEVDELISHNIFYTAITRAKNELKIYWTAEVEKKVLERIVPRNINDDIEVLKTIM